MSGTLSCSVLLLCFAILGVMLLKHVTISNEDERVCALTNYRKYLNEGKNCSVKCVNGEERIKCSHLECHKILKTNMQNVTMTVDCYRSEEFFTFTYDMKCDSKHFNVYYNNPKCRTDCYSGVKRTICQSKRCSRSNSNNKNCTMHCDFAEQWTPCFHEQCHPHTYEAENGQRCTVTCDSGYKYIICSYLQCKTKNFTYFDSRTELNYECSEYCENGERYYVCPGHPKYRVPAFTNLTNTMITLTPENVYSDAMAVVPRREHTAKQLKLSHFQKNKKLEAKRKFKKYDDEELTSPNDRPATTWRASLLA